MQSEGGLAEAPVVVAARMARPSAALAPAQTDAEAAHATMAGAMGGGNANWRRKEGSGARGGGGGEGGRASKPWGGAPGGSRGRDDVCGGVALRNLIHRRALPRPTPSDEQRPCFCVCGRGRGGALRPAEGSAPRGLVPASPPRWRFGCVEVAFHVFLLLLPTYDPLFQFQCIPLKTNFLTFT